MTMTHPLLVTILDSGERILTEGKCIGITIFAEVTSWKAYHQPEINRHMRLNDFIEFIKVASFDIKVIRQDQPT